MPGIDQYSKFFKPDALNALIKEIPVPANYIGQEFLPIEETFDTDFNETVLTRQQDMAQMVDAASDDYPLTDNDPGRTVSGSIVDIAQSYVVTKKELMALADKGNERKRLLIEKQLLGKTTTLIGNIQARIEWMRWQALGKGVLTTNAGNIKLNLDFGVSAGHKKTAATLWSAGGAAILTDYMGWVQTYKDDNGIAPDEYVTSSRVINTVIKDTAVRQAITGATTTYITIAQLNAFLRDLELPPMRAYDEKVTVRDVTTGGTRTGARLLADNVGVFLRKGGEIGVQLLGPTLENDMNPGVFARTLSQEKPKREIIDAVAASFPKIENPDLIFITTVLT